MSERRGAPIQLHPRQQELVARLILYAGQAIPRARVAMDLWPDSSQATGLNNLRQLLHDLRAAWPGAGSWIVANRQSLTWNTAESFLLDVSEFRTTADIGRDEKDGEPRTPYAGLLLPDCYAEWIVPLRDELHRLYLSALLESRDRAEEKGDLELAIVLVQRLLDEESLREDLYSDLMGLHMAAGNRAGALRVYHQCASVLELELGVAPGKSVQDRYAEILGDVAVESEAARSKPSPLIGREKEWARLQEHWHRAAPGTPSIICLTGDPGVGKTRLAEEMVRWCHRQNLRTAWASCHQGEGSIPFAAVQQLLSGAKPDTVPDDVRWELAALLEPVPGKPAFAPVSDAWQRRLLLDAFSVVLFESLPLLLVVDDIQWIDPDSLLALEYALRRCPHGKLVVIATDRSGPGEGPAHPFRDEKLGAYVIEIELQPLSPSETIRLAAVDNPAAAQWSSQERERIFAETEGNPLFVVEMSRAGWWRRRSDHLPDPLQATIKNRFHKLSPAARELLAVAAILGSKFSSALLTEVANTDESDLVAAVDELWSLRILRETSTGYEFSHGKLRDVAYSDLSRTRRRRLHELAAEAFRNLGPLASAGNLAEVARHSEFAGLLDGACSAYADAAEAAIQARAYETAVVQFTHAARLSPLENKGTFLLRSAQTLQLAGQWAEARDAFDDCLIWAREMDDPATALGCRIGIGELLILQGEYESALSWLLQTETDVKEPVEARRLNRLTGMVCECLIWLARYREAEERAQQHLAQAEVVGDRAELAAALTNLGTVYARRTEYDPALDLYRRALAIEENSGDGLSLVASLGRLGNLHRLRGEFHTAETVLRRQVAIAMSLGSAHAEAVAASNLGNLLLEADRLDEAEQQLSSALSIAERLGERQREAAMIGNLGVLEQKRGHLREAWELLTQSLQLQLETGDRRNAAVALTSIGQVYLESGQFGAARRCLAAATAVSLELGNFQNTALALAAVGEALFRSGERDLGLSLVRSSLRMTERLKMSYWVTRSSLLLDRLQSVAEECPERLESAGGNAIAKKPTVSSDPLPDPPAFAVTNEVPLGTVLEMLAGAESLSGIRFPTAPPD